jgi:hypothetical protein
MGWFDFDFSNLFDLGDVADIAAPAVDTGGSFISDVSDIALGGATDPSLYGLAGDIASGDTSYLDVLGDVAQVPQASYVSPFISDVSDIALGGQTDPALYGVAADLSANNQTYESIYPDWLYPQPPEYYGGGAPTIEQSWNSPGEQGTHQFQGAPQPQDGSGSGGWKPPAWLSQIMQGLGKLAIPAILAGLAGSAAKAELQKGMGSSTGPASGTFPGTGQPSIRPLPQQVGPGKGTPRPGTLVNPELGGLPNLPKGPWELSQGITPGRQQHYGGFSIAA